MAARIFCVFMICILLVWASAFASGDIVEDLITPEAILDGMLHFEADQGLTDFKVNVLQTTSEADNTEVYQVEMVLYFLAPNLQLTMVGDEPRSLQSNASFQAFLSNMDIERGKDTVIEDEDCYKIVATPKAFGRAEYTKTYYISKADFHKIRIESIRSEKQFKYIRYVTDYFYDEYDDGENIWTLICNSDVAAYTDKNKKVFDQRNEYYDYDVNSGLTRKDFEKMLKGYKTYYSEGI